ncbi:MAG: hypothetical protein V4689_10795 [Verrucomicrobiota bacterium]
MAAESPTESKSQKWKKILVHEMFEYFFNFAFLAVFLVAFAWYRRLLLASYHIEYSGYWTPLVEAAIFAKVIMIGDALRVGRRFQNRPLALTTLYRTIVFSGLVILFAFAEHIIGAVVHGKPASAGIAEIASKGLDEVLAWCVVMIAAFLPFFAVKELERAFGPEKIRGMFFSRHAEGTDSPAAGKDEATKP